jgi:hypothetical protein
VCPDSGQTFIHKVKQTRKEEAKFWPSDVLEVAMMVRSWIHQVYSHMSFTDLLIVDCVHMCDCNFRQNGIENQDTLLIINMDHVFHYSRNYVVVD